MYNSFPMNVGGPDLNRPAFWKKSLEVRDKKSERFKVAADALLLALKGEHAMLWKGPRGRKQQVGSRSWPLADGQHESGNLNFATTRLFLPITTRAQKKTPSSRRKCSLADTSISTCETLNRESSHASSRLLAYRDRETINGCCFKLLRLLHSNRNLIHSSRI